MKTIITIAILFASIYASGQNFHAYDGKSTLEYRDYNHPYPDSLRLVKFYPVDIKKYCFSVKTEHISTVFYITQYDTIVVIDSLKFNSLIKYSK